MSLLFFEGWETVGTETGLANQATTRPRMNLRWDATSSGGLPASDSFFLIDDSFSEGFAVQMGSNGFSNGNYFQWDIPSGKQGVGASATEFIVGCRVHIPTPANSFSIMQVYNSTPGGATADFSVNCINSADVSVSRFVGGTIETSTGVFTADTWAYVECAFTISSGSASNGSYDVYVDGNQELVDTTARTNGNFFSIVEFIRFNNMSGASTADGDWVGYDDIYILEVDGTDPEDFQGAQIRVLSFPPDGDGTNTDWTTSTGSTHYTLIDENGADASDYVETSTDTDEDMFDFGDNPAGGNYIALKVEAEAIAQTTTSHTLDVRVDSSTNIAETNHAVTDTVNYDVFVHYQTTDPNGGGAWTEAGVDAAEAGVQFNT